MIVVSEPNILTPSILSRWYVIESVRTRGGQYKFTLRRDVVADKLANNYNEMINAPILVDRAMITDVHNPLLYNPEGFSFNQIKKQEILLKDGTNSAWYILYFKKGLGAKQISFTPGESIEDHTIVTPIAQSIFGTSGTLHRTTNVKTVITYVPDTPSYIPDGVHAVNSKRFTVTEDALTFTNYERTYGYEVLLLNNTQDTIVTKFNTAFTNQYTTLKNSILIDEGLTSQIQVSDLPYLEWDNQVVKDSNNKLYRVHVYKVNNSQGVKYVTSGNLKTTCVNLLDSVDTWIKRTGNSSYGYSYDDVSYTFSYEEIEDPNALSLTIDWTNMAKTLHSDYNILAIPYNTIQARLVPVLNVVTVPEDWSNMLVHAIMGAYTGEGELVDIQVLPYFPIPTRATTPVSASLTEEIFTYTDDRGIVIYFIKDANYSLNITQNIAAEANYIDRKIQNETQVVRLCSPNYNGVFEFSVAKNDGVDLFNVDVTLKPYNPYIHINPNFKGLYGQDFDDAKGLICGGDFSIPIWSTA